MTLYLFWRSAISRLKAVKNAKCEVHFVPNKKAAPQFAFANEEPLIEVRCKKATTFFNPTTTKTQSVRQMQGTQENHLRSLQT